ncbi:DUF6572 domain-containing protein [Actinomadura flavalba]|uniref:DUF6572 domain-containing protein n=1 Tax=Actinomadura flavalba TaxID=1120938 RepID=UPI00036EB43E|nr:DUF6572 domain-containing protein [Actinomadura flavalba]
MTVENPDSIDQITVNNEKSVYTLDMVETRPFTDSEAQREQIAEKINLYLEVIQTGQLYEQFPDIRGKELRVRLVCTDEPADDRLVQLLTAGTGLFAKHGVDFAVEVIPREFVEN